MSQVRINVAIPSGDLEVIVPMHLTISDSGTAHLRDALLEASNRVLRAYGKEEITIPSQEAEQPKGQHWLTEDHNTDPVCECGWRPENMWPRELPVTRTNGRDLVRRHILASQP